MGGGVDGWMGRGEWWFLPAPNSVEILRSGRTDGGFPVLGGVFSFLSWLFGILCSFCLESLALSNIRIMSDRDLYT